MKLKAEEMKAAVIATVNELRQLVIAELVIQLETDSNNEERIDDILELVDRAKAFKVAIEEAL